MLYQYSLLLPGKSRKHPVKFSLPGHTLWQEVISLDLRNQTITVGELLDNPKSRAVFQRRFGKFMNHPMVKAARSLTLKQLAEMAAVYLPKKTIEDTIRELQRL